MAAAAWWTPWRAAEKVAARLKAQALQQFAQRQLSAEAARSWGGGADAMSVARQAVQWVGLERLERRRLLAALRGRLGFGLCLN